MGTPLSTLLLVIFGIYIGICALLLDAKKIHGIDFHPSKFAENLPQEPPLPQWLPPPSPPSHESPLPSPPAIPGLPLLQSPPPPDSPSFSPPPPSPTSPELAPPPSAPPPESLPLTASPPLQSLSTPPSPLPEPPLSSPPYSENSPQEPIDGDGTKSPAQTSNGSHRGHMSPQPQPPSSAEMEMNSAQRGKRNSGKMVGVVFVGFAVVLQIAVAGFLGFKRRQLLMETGNP